MSPPADSCLIENAVSVQPDSALMENEATCKGDADEKGIYYTHTHTHAANFKLETTPLITHKKRSFDAKFRINGRVKICIACSKMEKGKADKMKARILGLNMKRNISFWRG